MKISKNYQMKEFAVSAKAAARGIPPFSVPEKYQQNVVNLVVNLLQPINDATGWFNVISSGYRPDNVNKIVGGSPTSDHRFGKASDNNFYARGKNGNVKISSYDVAAKVRELGLSYDQMILYPTFVHLSYRTKDTNRKQLLYSKSYTGKRF